MRDANPTKSATTGYASPTLAVAPDGPIIIADQNAHRIRAVTPDGVIRTIAGDGTMGFRGDGGPAINSRLSMPSSAASDAQGIIYIADVGNQRARKVDLAGNISTVAGTGAIVYAGDPSLNSLRAVAIDFSGMVYIAQSNEIKRLTPGGVIGTIAGGCNNGFCGDGGPAIGDGFNQIYGLVIDPSGRLLVADGFNHRIRALTPVN